MTLTARGPGWRLVTAAVLGLALLAALSAVCWHGVQPLLGDAHAFAWLTPASPASRRRQAANLVVLPLQPGVLIVIGVLLAVVVLVITRHVLWSWITLLGPALAGAGEIGLKHVVHRAPPGATMVVSGSELSFPSGHATAVSARATVVVLVVWAATRRPLWRAVVVVAACAITLAMDLSLVTRADHFATDVVGGTLLGFSAPVLVAAVFFQIAAHRRSRPRQRGVTLD